jgi:hypothetical protein
VAFGPPLIEYEVVADCVVGSATTMSRTDAPVKSFEVDDFFEPLRAPLTSTSDWMLVPVDVESRLTLR